MRQDKIQQLKDLQRQFKDLSPVGRLCVTVLVMIGLGVIAAAERDIQLRSAAEVRGSKLLWRLVCLNVLGAPIYLRWGRRGK
jgi:hypothetical protein